MFSLRIWDLCNTDWTSAWGFEKVSWLSRLEKSFQMHHSYYYCQMFLTACCHLCVLNVVTSELVMLSLDLVKTRLSVMNMEMRKNFIQVILTSLIEKSPDPKILRAVVKIVEEWVKNSGNPMATNQVNTIIMKSKFPQDRVVLKNTFTTQSHVFVHRNLTCSFVTWRIDKRVESSRLCSARPWEHLHFPENPHFRKQDLTVYF